MRVITATLITMLVFSTANLQAQTQNAQIRKFWQLSDFRATNQLMSDANRSIYFTIIRELYPNKSMSSLLAAIETISRDGKLQDYLFLRFMEMYGSDELLRLQMADICGTYTLGNYISGYIVRQYSKDKRYLQFVKDRQVKREEEIISQTKENNNKTVIQDTTEEKVFARVEFEAEFPGGAQKWIKYLKEELQKIDSLPPLQIIVRYIIAKDGSVTDPQIETPIDDVVGRKILAIFIHSARWIPAMQEGKAVNAYRRQPINLGYPDE